MPLFEMKKTAWWAVLKELHVVSGGEVENFVGGTLLSSTGSSSGDEIQLTYKGNGQAVPVTLTFIIGTDGSTVDDLVSFYAGELVLDDVGIMLFDITYIPTTTSKMNRGVIRLEGTYLKIYVKSDLKIQNRTVGSAGDVNEDDITNAPIYGKSYFGVGVGPRLRASDQQRALTANTMTGISTLGSNSSGVSGLLEPLDYQYFTNVSKIGKVHLDPGHIKTSVLTKTLNILFGNFLNIINPQVPDSTGSDNTKSYVNKKLAVYRMFALEKMIDSNATENTTVVAVGYEHNVRISANVKTIRKVSTKINFEKIRRGTT